MNPVSTHPNLFKAAAEGHADEPFKKDTRSNEIRGLLTAQAKNRIRHINIISQKSKTGSTKFMEEILEICPSVLHKSMPKAILRSTLLRNLAILIYCPADDENNTALHEAVCHGNVQVVKILTGQDPDYPYSANNYGKTQLYLAAKGRYSEMVIELLENSTSVSYEGPNGKTALHAAAMHFYYGKCLVCSSENWVIIAASLLNNKVIILKPLFVVIGWTPIHYAAYYDQYQLIHMLLKRGSNCFKYCCQRSKMTALRLAAGQRHARTVKTILSLNPEFNGEGDTPLPVAAKFGHFNIANVLIKREKLAQHEDEELES
ncbi:hypothetical protein CISIN_1g040452mg, partial [Citrus sinensis]